MRKPNFMIVGVQKAATTSLHYYLNQHRDIYLTNPKEIHFFDSLNSISTDLFRVYLKNFNLGVDSILVGESTPNYCFYPGAIEKIKTYLPDIKIIIVLRDPIDRAYSHYWHEKKLGWENLSYTEAILRRSEETDSYYRHFTYIERGLYTGQINKLKKYFGCQSVHVMRYEDIRRDALGAVNDVIRFLDPSLDSLETIEESVQNSGAIPRYNGLLQVSAKLNNIFGANALSVLISRHNIMETKYSKMSSEERSFTARKLIEGDSELVNLYPDLIRYV